MNRRSGTSEETATPKGLARFVDSPRTFLAAGGRIVEGEAPAVPRELLDGIVFAYPYADVYKEAGVDLQPRGDMLTLQQARALLSTGMPEPREQLAEIRRAAKADARWRPGDPDPAMVVIADATMARLAREAGKMEKTGD